MDTDEPDGYTDRPVTDRPSGERRSTTTDRSPGGVILPTMAPGPRTGLIFDGTSWVNVDMDRLPNEYTQGSDR